MLCVAWLVTMQGGRVPTCVTWSSRAPGPTPGCISPANDLNLISRRSRRGSAHLLSHPQIVLVNYLDWVLASRSGSVSILSPYATFFPLIAYRYLQFLYFAPHPLHTDSRLSRVHREFHSPTWRVMKLPPRSRNRCLHRREIPDGFRQQSRSRNRFVQALPQDWARPFLPSLPARLQFAKSQPQLRPRRATRLQHKHRWLGAETQSRRFPVHQSRLFPRR
jgi:hypothetical protein